MANIAYIRVSTAEQNSGRQFMDLKEKGISIDRYYSDTVSGKNMERPQLKAMLDYVREGDTVYIESISRLARNTADFMNILQYIQSRNVGLVSLKENIDTTTPQGKFITTIFAALYELERANILERQKEGIKLCLNEGRPYGRPKQIFTDEFEERYKSWKDKKLKTKDFMALENIKARSTFYSMIKNYEKQRIGK
ncbi:recombinase family protein [Phascolarctobacterium faecium]|nr:recombinase family protein [Phascolarctobacterium faecium]MDM8112066.1 recombinase family protein [Phascolarctobacterium faecium]